MRGFRKLTHLDVTFFLVSSIGLKFMKQKRFRISQTLKSKSFGSVVRFGPPAIYRHVKFIICSGVVWEKTKVARVDIVSSCCGVIAFESSFGLFFPDSSFVKLISENLPSKVVTTHMQSKWKFNSFFNSSRYQGWCHIKLPFLNGSQAQRVRLIYLWTSKRCALFFGTRSR